MLVRSSSWIDFRKDSTAGELVALGGKPAASCQPGIEGSVVNLCSLVDVPVPAPAGRGIVLLTVVVTQDEPPCLYMSAGVGGGGTSPEVSGVPVPSGAEACPLASAGATSLRKKTSGSAYLSQALFNETNEETLMTKKGEKRNKLTK